MFDSNIPFTILGPEDSSIFVFDAATLLNDSQSQSKALFQKAIADIKVIRRKYITVCACSFGKDSTVTLLANLIAHIELMREGVLDETSPMVVSHIDTGVENHLMVMLCNMEIKRLKAFCADNNINLDFRFSTPPLAKQWSSLFLSNQKLISSSRTQNDCSVIMKVDNAAQLEKSIERDYQGKSVTLLGSRLDESVARGAKMRRAGTDKVTADNLIKGDSPDDRVFAPIMDMNDEDVWNIIRGAGSNPITDMGFEIESWATNHRLLNIIYADSKDGSCAYSAKKIKGDKAAAGGCGGSARTGCYTCAKAVTDKSGEEQAKKPRHAVISGNMLKVRNYIMWVAQDIQYRTFHSRAVDHTTGAIALQPNVMRSEILEKLIWYMTQITFEDQIRAERFTSLVEQGKELQDAGYRDIMTDPLLNEDDRTVLAEAYLEQAQHHLIKPMTLEIALYLSAIHARDGVRLPPHRALWIWDQVSKGKRIPYPDVDPKNAVISDIPDAIMAIPSKHVTYPSISEFDFLSIDSAKSCEINLAQFNTVMPIKDAKHFLVDENSHHISDKTDRETITVNGISAVKWATKVRANPLSKPAPKKFSKRAIKKVSRKNGGYKITERGRTSLDSPSFSHRSSSPHSEALFTQEIPLYVNDKGLSESLNLDPDHDAIMGYDINIDALYDWLQFGGVEEALNAHNRTVEARNKANESIYLYGGMGAFQHYARYGIFRLNAKALSSTKRILQRTAYFSRLGLLSIDEDAIIDLSTRTASDMSIKLCEYRDIQTQNMTIDIDAILPMFDYRQYKARQLAPIRAERNVRRSELKALIKSFNTTPFEAAVAQLTLMGEKAIPFYADAFENLIVATTLIDNGVTGFDNSDYAQEKKINQGIIRHIRATFTDKESMKRLFDPVFYKAIVASGKEYQLILAGKGITAMLEQAESKVISEVSARLERGQMVRKEDMLMSHKGITTLSKIAHKKERNMVKRSFTLNSTMDISNVAF